MPRLPRVKVNPPKSYKQDDLERNMELLAVLQFVLGINEDGSQGGMLEVHFIELIKTMPPI